MTLSQMLLQVGLSLASITPRSLAHTKSVCVVFGWKMAHPMALEIRSPFVGIGTDFMPQLCRGLFVVSWLLISE